MAEVPLSARSPSASETSYIEISSEQPIGALCCNHLSFLGTFEKLHALGDPIIHWTDNRLCFGLPQCCILFPARSSGPKLQSPPATWSLVSTLQRVPCRACDDVLLRVETHSHVAPTLRRWPLAAAELRLTGTLLAVANATSGFGPRRNHPLGTSTVLPCEPGKWDVSQKNRRNGLTHMGKF